MRLSYSETHRHLDSIHAASENLAERASEMLDEALSNHRHPATWEDPAWFDRIGCALLDSADEAMQMVEALGRFHAAVYDYVEGVELGVTARSIKAAYHRILEAEALV